MRITSSVSGETKVLFNVANELSAVLIWRHAEVLFNRLKARDDYARWAEKIMCGETKIKNLYRKKDFDFSLIKNGEETKLIQGRTDTPYTSSHDSIDDTLYFLVLYDLWQQDDRISDFYRTLPNQEVALFLFPLRYSPGTATAEDELRAGYNQHFGLEGQNSLDARIDQSIVHMRTTGLFSLHVEAMSHRICNILRQDGNILPEVYIEDGRGSGDEVSGKKFFTVRLDLPSDNNVTIDWRLRSFFHLGNPVLFDPYSGSLTFIPGETSKDINVRFEVVSDISIAPDDIFMVGLEKASGALVTDSIGEVTYINDAPPSVPISDAPPSVPISDAPPSVPDDDEDYEEAIENREVIMNGGKGCALALNNRSENTVRNSLSNLFLIILVFFLTTDKKRKDCLAIGARSFIFSAVTFILHLCLSITSLCYQRCIILLGVSPQHNGWYRVPVAVYTPAHISYFLALRRIDSLQGISRFP